MLKKALIGLTAASAASLLLASPAAAKEVEWILYPDQVQPGGTINAMTKAAVGGCNPAGPVTSAGFAEPLEWTGAGNFGKHYGATTVTRTPGEYTATFTCAGSRGVVVSTTFTIIGTPPATSAKPTPKPTVPKPAKPAKPQVKVKPAGAPQTGDGSLG